MLIFDDFLEFVFSDAVSESPTRDTEESSRLRAVVLSAPECLENGASLDGIESFFGL